MRFTSGGVGYELLRGIAPLDGLGIVGEKHHTLEENIDVQSLVDLARLFAALLTRLS